MIIKTESLLYNDNLYNERDLKIVLENKFGDFIVDKINKKLSVDDKLTIEQKMTIYEFLIDNCDEVIDILKGISDFNDIASLKIKGCM